MNTGELLLELNSAGLCYKKKVGLFRFEDKWAFRNISFKLYQGETLGICGKNGAGKSSLLRLIAGITEVDEGELIRHTSASVNLLTIQSGFVAHLTGEENAILIGMMKGDFNIKNKLTAIAEFSDIGDAFYESVNTYSDGMRARLGFSIAKTLQPDILLIDEVMSVGDQDFRQKSLKEIKKKIKSNQTTIIVSHNHAMMAELCTRILYL